MKHYVVSAFKERRPRIVNQLKDRGFRDVEIIESPIASAVVQRYPELHADPAWRDPLENRIMTWGELACIAGHRQLQNR